MLPFVNTSRHRTCYVLSRLRRRSISCRSHARRSRVQSEPSGKKPQANAGAFTELKAHTHYLHTNRPTERKERSTGKGRSTGEEATTHRKTLSEIALREGCINPMSDHGTRLAILMQLQQCEDGDPYTNYNALETVTVTSCINSVLGNGCRSARSVPAHAIGTDGAHNRSSQTGETSIPRCTARLRSFSPCVSCRFVL